MILLPDANSPLLPAILSEAKNLSRFITNAEEGFFARRGGLRMTELRFIPRPA